jgi:hypothetical protein
MIFNTKGFTEAAGSQVAKLEASLLKASDNGRIPIVCDTSPCLGQIKGGLSEPALKCAPPLQRPLQLLPFKHQLGPSLAHSPGTEHEWVPTDLGVALLVMVTW